MNIEKIYIYAIYFPMSGKYYIGQTKNLQGRLCSHLNSKYLVGNALRKYDDWTVELLHTCKSRDAANLLEIEEIRHYNCVTPNGYNLTRGGEGVSGGHWNLSEKTKKKISDSLKGRTFPTMIGENNSMSGRKRPDVVKRNKENKYAQGRKRPDVSKRNKENNPCSHSAQSELKRLRTRITKLEAEIK